MEACDWLLWSYRHITPTCLVQSLHIGQYLVNYNNKFNNKQLELMGDDTVVFVFAASWTGVCTRFE